MPDTITPQPEALEQTPATALETQEAEQPQQTDQTQEAEQTPAAPETAPGAEAETDEKPAESAPEAETEKAGEPEKTAEPEAPKEDADALRAQLMDAELRAAAAIQGIPQNRIPYAVRLADASKASEAKSLAAFAQEQIQKILQDVPELRQHAAGTGSAGNHQRMPIPETTPEEQAVKAAFKQRF